MKWFLNLLERFGRHEVLLDAYGKIYWHRYYLLHSGKAGDNSRWIDKLPNIHLHIFENTEPDGEDEHSHPWNGWGLVLRGHYKEIVNGTKERVTRAGRIAFTKHTDSHRLAYVEPGTVILFFHGFLKNTWRFHVKQHAKICDFCAKENNGVCYKKAGTTDFAGYMYRAEGEAKKLSRVRTMTWTRVDETFKRQYALRQRALKKLNLQSPETKTEARQIILKVMAERDKEVSNAH